MDLKVLFWSILVLFWFWILNTPGLRSTEEYAISSLPNDIPISGAMASVKMSKPMAKLSLLPGIKIKIFVVVM